MPLSEEEEQDFDSSEIQFQLDEHKRKIEKLEETVYMFNEIKLLAYGGGSVLDGLTKHISSEGIADKLRELKKEMLSKTEFKTESMKLLGKPDLEAIRKDMKI